MEKDNLKEVEGSYLVLDWSDVREALSEENLDWFEQIIFAVRHNREVENGKEPLEGIFVERSYPFYEDTLQKVKIYFKQKNRKVVTMVSLGGQSMSVMEDINPKRPSKGICIKITGHEEYIVHSVMVLLSLMGFTMISECIQSREMTSCCRYSITTMDSLIFIRQLSHP